MQVEEGREACQLEPGHEFVGKRGGIPPRIRDEDLELLPWSNVSHGVISCSERLSFNLSEHNARF
jgi:hypothetical protein